MDWMKNTREHEKYMQRCLDLARSGRLTTAPNPMVGAVIVHNGKIIGEGYHQCYGEAHAEVNAIGNVSDPSLLAESTIYVSLEPCSHHGKTPPCSDLIIDKKIPRVVIGSIDPYHEVSGNGIRKLKSAGIEVLEGILSKKCMALNKRFFTYHKQKRPYIILKWAQSADGLVDRERIPGDPVGPNWITGKGARMLVHKWRSEADAILCGVNTAVYDNPRLNVRDWKGPSPLRCLIDPNSRVPQDANIIDGSIPTLVYSLEYQVERGSSCEIIKIKDKEHLPEEICQDLYKRQIQSVIIEGGAYTISHFIKKNLWDEARVFVGEKFFLRGIKAPVLPVEPVEKYRFDRSSLSLFKNQLI